MQKPNNFDNVQVSGDFTPVELGGHHMIIKQVSESKTKTDKDMIVVLFDFAKDDKQPEYFSELFKSDVRPDKKWPYNGTNYIVCLDNAGQCSKGFKSFITAVENSNPGFVTSWGDGPQFAAQFKNKKIGGVFGKIEEEYNGERRMRTRLRYFCRDDAAETASVPNDKYLASTSDAAAPMSADGFIGIGAGSEEALPF